MQPSTLRIPDITYHRPGSLDEAFDLVRSLGSDARFLAGGTELVPELRRGRSDARHLVSLRDVPGLSGIVAEDAGALRIGAMTSIADVADSEILRAAYPALSEAAAWIGSVQIRERATIGGNFCGAVPCADTPPTVIVGGGLVRLVSASGERTLPAEDFFVAPRETVLSPGEILAEIILPEAGAGGFGAAYERFGLRRGMAVAVASVAASLRIEGGRIRDGRISLGAVAPTPLLARKTSDLLTGREPDPEIFEAVARAAGEEARPICDVRGSEDYRRDVVAVLARRALHLAADRAAGGAS